MSGPATRFVPHIALLCLVALVPVVVHAYLGLRVDDCRRSDSFAPATFAPRRPTDRAEFMDRHFDASHWREGTISGRGVGPDLRYAIVRSHDAKRLYHRAEHVFVPRETPSAHRTDWIEADGSALPVHRALYAPMRGSSVTGFAAWILLYDGAPVRNPYLAQILAAPKLALRGGVPMTLAFVSGFIAPSELPAAEATATDWLLRTARDYERLCAAE